MASHAKVVSNWIAGKSANGYAMSTDGENLYSYAMKIGRTLADGTKQSLDLSGYYNVSSSTAKHATYARRGADEVILPQEVNGNSYQRGSRYVFPSPNSEYRVVLTNKIWKTEKGARNNLGEGLAAYVEETYYGWRIVGYRNVDEIGHVSVAYYIP